MMAAILEASKTKGLQLGTISLEAIEIIGKTSHTAGCKKYSQ
jgi:hypothetical protein